MKICGFNKTTLLDYPGKVAAVLFLGGCNFRCPFCQNAGLVLHPEKEDEYDPEKILAFLKKRKGILEGVCVSGGEPTIWKELPDLVRSIKDLGYSVKLDTNGTNPEMLGYFIRERLIDMAAMDIKSSPENYGKLIGMDHPDLTNIMVSADLLLQGELPYEFRTTVVRELHETEDFRKIGAWLSGAKAYYLQAYRDSEGVICPGFTSYSYKELEQFRDILSESIEKVGIRGIDP